MILAARLVAPMDRPPITDGAVRVQETRIVEVGQRRDVTGEPVEDLGDAVLLPGLINAHAHLGLSAYAGRFKPSGLLRWMGRLIKVRRKTQPSVEQAAAMQAAEESLRAGVTCIADVSHRNETWTALRRLSVRKVCFAELITLARKGIRNPEELARLVAGVQCDDRFAVGVSPHAPYTVSAEHIAAAVRLARDREVPITIHWSETKEECRWIERGGGVLGALIRAFGGKGIVASPRCTPMEYAERLGLLEVGALLAHVNYISDDDLDRLSASRASVVFCPRSHRFFGHRHHRWRDMLTAGVNVCVGTDSAASLPAGGKLSVLDDLRLLRQDHPDVGSETLLSMVTTRAAHALGLDGRLGSLTPGKLADLVAVPIRAGGLDDSLTHILNACVKPFGVWIDGQRVEGADQCEA